jgi:hypothetical protein
MGKDRQTQFIIKIKGHFHSQLVTKIILTNGATSSNIFWIIDGGLDVGASSEPKGISSV